MSDTLTPELVAEGYLSAEFLAEREQYRVDRDGKKVFVGCGDDRPPTEESAAALASEAPENTMDPAEGYASIFGGLAGTAKNILVVGAAQYGEEFIEAVGGFEGVVERLAQSENPQTLHSAEGNEDSPVTFCDHGNNPVGCAYCMGVGATSEMLTNEDDTTILDIGRDNQTRVFGSDDGVDKIVLGHKLYLKHATHGKGGSFVVDRSAYKDYLGKGIHFMNVRGSHVSARRSGVISDFDITKVSNPTDAHKDGNDYYRLSIGAVTEMALKAMEGCGYKLSPELLMRAFLLDSTPVRAVLVAHDKDEDLHGKLDPNALPMGFVGNPWESIAQLEQQFAA